MIKSASKSIRTHRSLRTSEDIQTNTVRLRQQRAARDESNKPGFFESLFQTLAALNGY